MYNCTLCDGSVQSAVKRLLQGCRPLVVDSCCAVVEFEIGGDKMGGGELITVMRLADNGYMSLLPIINPPDWLLYCRVEVL